MQERIRAVRVPPMIGRAIGRADTGDQSQEGSEICLALFACLVIVPAIVLIGFTAAGPLQCTLSEHNKLVVSEGGVTIGLICVVLFILLLCFCIQLFQGEDSGACRSIIYCCNCLAILLLLGLLIADTVLLYQSKYDTSCKYSFSPTPFATVVLTYAFIIFTSCCWCLSCCVVLISHKRDGQKTRSSLIKQDAP